MTRISSLLSGCALLMTANVIAPAQARTSETLDVAQPADASRFTQETATAPVPAPRIAYPSSGREAHSALFRAIRTGSWSEARGRALALDASNPVRAVALAEIYTAKDSPRAELFDILQLVEKDNWLPSADQLARMAQKRGAQILPDMPQTQKLVWLGGASRREYVSGTRIDPLAQSLAGRIQSYVKADDPAGAESLLASGEAGLSPDGLAEVRQRVAWAYYIENDAANARRMAERALQAGSYGDWATQAYWTIGLSAWRQNDPRASAAAFVQVATRAANDDMASAGSYWAARAYMNAGEPRKVEPLLRTAALKQDTFYGLLARETLGIAARTPAAGNMAWSNIRDLPAVRAAIAMHDINEDDRADELIRRQAELGGAAHYNALVALSTSLGLAETQLWLAHHGPSGQKPDMFARFPTPKWRPDGGWRVDPALIFAHALQESQFRPTVVSSAGARGVMQVMPGTASEMAGYRVSAAQLNNPGTNLEYGQRYLEALRDNSATGGLLPKVMAAYNAGPLPVSRWNAQVHDNGDPLLFIESLPYYETRAYVNIVMRNYWVYQMQGRGKAEALTTMAQGGWPKFPTASAVLAAGGGSANSVQTATASDTLPTNAQLSYSALAPDAH